MLFFSCLQYSILYFIYFSQFFWDPWQGFRLFCLILKRSDSVGSNYSWDDGSNSVAWHLWPFNVGSWMTSQSCFSSLHSRWVKLPQCGIPPFPFVANPTLLWQGLWHLPLGSLQPKENFSWFIFCKTTSQKWLVLCPKSLWFLIY